MTITSTSTSIRVQSPAAPFLPVRPPSMSSRCVLILLQPSGNASQPLLAFHRCVTLPCSSHAFLILLNAKYSPVAMRPSRYSLTTGASPSHVLLMRFRTYSQRQIFPSAIVCRRAQVATRFPPVRRFPMPLPCVPELTRNPKYYQCQHMSTRGFPSVHRPPVSFPCVSELTRNGRHSSVPAYVGVS